MQLKLTLVFVMVLAAACTRTETVPTTTTGVAPPPDNTTTTVIADLVVVPDVVGFVLRGAVIAANRVGLEIVVNEGDPVADGSLVVAQEPPGGTQLQPGSVVGVRTEARVKGRPEPVGAMADLLRGLEELDYTLIRGGQSNFWFTGNNSAHAVIGEPGLLNIWVYRDTPDRLGDWRIFKEGAFPIPAETLGDFVGGKMAMGIGLILTTNVIYDHQPSAKVLIVGAGVAAIVGGALYLVGLARNHVGLRAVGWVLYTAAFLLPSSLTLYLLLASTFAIPAVIPGWPLPDLLPPPHDGT